MSDAEQAQLPRWKCHKEVSAAKISSVHVMDDGAGVLWLDVAPGQSVSFAVQEGWLSRHNPEPGGYYVQYADGYCSYSPAGAFEDGYTRLP